MMRWIVATSLRFRFLVVAVAAALMVVRRRRSCATMPVDVFPEFAPPRVEIQTTCLGLSAGRGRVSSSRSRWSRRSTASPGLDDHALEVGAAAVRRSS